MKCLYANSIAPVETMRSVASHLGLYCLSLSKNHDARAYKKAAEEIRCVFDDNSKIFFVKAS